jgi:tryptophan halogenase
MQSAAIKKIVIVGGGTAGWMSAAALSHFFEDQDVSIHLVESEQIGTVGVGEATLPHLRFFNQTLGIDEAEFMRRTQATYKTGIEFSHWGKQGDAYIHPFGDYGFPLNGVDFHHHWLSQREAGDATRIDDYSMGVVAAEMGRFAYPDADPRSVRSTYAYAFHIDAGLYAKFLREYAEEKGVVRVEGKVKSVGQNSKTGFIESVSLESGYILDGELFIDCSGFRGLLIEQTLKAGYQDWSEYLPCDRAIAIPTEAQVDPLPYTRAMADKAGWRWRIPLQHRVGNGHVYCSDYLSDDEALDSLLTNLEGEPLAEPNFLRFKTGKRSQCWSKNCVAIGLSGGFLEPLESTSIYLIQIAIMKLMELFPDVHCENAERDEFNRLIDTEYNRVKDFLILHYHATARDDSEFWNYCRNMPVPDSLQEKIDLFQAQGHVVEYKDGLFLKPSWVAVLLGQGIYPERYDQRARQVEPQVLQAQLKNLTQLIRKAGLEMPKHAEAIAQYCANNSGHHAPRARMSLYGRRQ